MGFTFTELLVSISILGFLAALLFPTLRNSLERGGQAKCAANLRQLSMAMLAYAGENSQMFPSGYWITSEGTTAKVWDKAIQPYVGSGSKEDFSRILICPNDRLPKLTNPRRTYSMIRAGQSGVAITGYQTEKIGSRSLLSIEKPSGTIMLTEFSFAKAKGDSADNVMGQSAACVIDSPSLQMNSGNGKTIHNGMFHYAFVDGHVECLNPEQTVGTGTLASPKGQWTIYAND